MPLTMQQLMKLTKQATASDYYILLTLTRMEDHMQVDMHRNLNVADTIQILEEALARLKSGENNDEA